MKEQDFGKIREGSGFHILRHQMVGWHHRLDGHEFEQAPGAGGGRGSLARCNPWGRKESDTPERLNGRHQ